MKTWAKVDQNNIIIDVVASDTQIPGLIECPNYLGIGLNITTPPPSGWKSPEQIEQEDADSLEAVRNDAQVRAFIAMTPAQVDAYIQNNVGNLAEARQMLKFLARMLLRIAKLEYGG